MYKVFITLLVLSLSAMGCGQLRRQTPVEPVKAPPTYAELIEAAEKLCLSGRESLPGVYNPYRDARLIYNEAFDGFGPSKEYSYSLITCKIFQGLHESAIESVKIMFKRFPDEVRPLFLYLKLEMIKFQRPNQLDRYMNQDAPWELTQKRLKYLKEKYPGAEPDLVAELELLIAKSMGKAIARYERDQKEKEQTINMEDHELLVIFYGPSKVNECQNSILKYRKKGYKSVVWTVGRDDFGYFVCEVYGVPPKK